MTDKLRLIKSPLQNRPAAFWKCSVARTADGHTCSAGRSIQPPENEHPWWINSAQHNFCFWQFVRERSDADGSMKELVQTELASLFGWSNTKTHFLLKQAIQELTAALNEHGATELLENFELEDQGEFSINEELEDFRSDETE